MKTKLALIVASVILTCSLVANAYFYALQQHGLAENTFLEKQVDDLKSNLAIQSNQTNSLQSRKTNLETQKTILENQIANLQSQADNLKNEKTHILDENAAIQNHIDQVKQTGASKIVTRLGATDIRSTPAAGHPWSGVIRFYVSGEVWNVGTGSARDCRLHVTLYQSDIVANDTYVKIGTIGAGSYADVGANIYYAGVALTNWTIIPEYS